MDTEDVKQAKLAIIDAINAGKWPAGEGVTPGMVEKLDGRDALNLLDDMRKRHAKEGGNR